MRNVVSAPDRCP